MDENAEIASGLALQRRTASCHVGQVTALTFLTV
jgi:hypothetical protein